MTSPPPPGGEPTANTSTVPSEQHGPSIGSILFGAFLILIGILWLLDRTGTVDFSWKVILPGILVLVGLALIFESRAGSHDGLMTIGIILTVVLTLANLTNINLDASIGDNDARPATIDELESEYALGIGSQRLDLSQIDFPAGDTEVEASVGIGDLVVTLPEGVGARIEWSIGVGEVHIFGEEVDDGIGKDGETTTPDFESAEQRVILDLSVGIGKIEVIQ